MVHSGSILSLNTLSFGSSLSQTRDEELKAVTHAFNAAKGLGSQPGAIFLQDYEFDPAELLAALGPGWQAVRPWASPEHDTHVADAVVLFDSAVYAAAELEDGVVGGFRDGGDLLAGMQPVVKAQLSGFKGRWAGAELRVPGSGLHFVAVSYHGRKVLKVDGDVIPVQTSVKAAMAADFIAQVAERAGRGAAPALIAGCWNVDAAPLSAGGGLRGATWTSAVHLAQPRQEVDYAVTVQPLPPAAAAELRVTGVTALDHPPPLATHFQHRPFLVQLTVAPKA